MNVLKFDSELLFAREHQIIEPVLPQTSLPPQSYSYSTFDGMNVSRHTPAAMRRTNDQVKMIWHDDITHQVHCFVFDCPNHDLLDDAKTPWLPWEWNSLCGRSSKEMN